MRVLTGTDMIEISRIKDSIETLGDHFKNKIYTPKEIAYCESKKMAKYQHYAGRFAVKEAIYKAISELLDDKFEVSWQDAEILNRDDGKPYVTIANSKIANQIERMDVSISHCKEYATANVVLVVKE